MSVVNCCRCNKQFDLDKRAEDIVTKDEFSFLNLEDTDYCCIPCLTDFEWEALKKEI